MGERCRSRRLHFGLLGALLSLCLILGVVWAERQPTAWDPLGYQVAGRNIVQGLGPAVAHPFNATLGPYFTLAAFAVQRPQSPARLYLNYPPGFPLLLAMPQWLGLPDFYLLPLLSALGVLLIYVLGRLLFDRWVGLLGAAIVALTPGYLEWSSAFWADWPGACYMLGAMVAYVAAWRQETRPRRLVFCAGAGALVVGAIFIKYSNVLVLGPMLAYAVLTQRKAMFGHAANWLFVAVIVLGLSGLGIYNQVLHGSPFETHYSASRSGFDFPIFGLSYALGPSPVGGYALRGMAETLWKNFSWLLLLAALGLARGTRESVTLLGGLLLVFGGLFGIYAWAPVQVNARFLLPLFAPIGLFAARGCLTVLDLRTTWRKWLLGGLLVAVGGTLWWSLPQTWRTLEARNRDGARMRQAAQELTAGSAPDAVFLAYLWNDQVNYFGERTTFFYRRINVDTQAEFEETLLQVVAQLLRDGRPVYYVGDRQPPLVELLAQEYVVSLWKEAAVPVYKVDAR